MSVAFEALIIGSLMAVGIYNILEAGAKCFKSAVISLIESRNTSATQ